MIINDKILLELLDHKVLASAFAVLANEVALIVFFAGLMAQVVVVAHVLAVVTEIRESIVETILSQENHFM